MIEKIESIEDVKIFFQQLSEEDLNFHPDTPFEDYVNIETSEPTYSTEKAKIRNKLLNNCFRVCTTMNMDIYDIAFRFSHGSNTVLQNFVA